MAAIAAHNRHNTCFFLPEANEKFIVPRPLLFLFFLFLHTRIPMDASSMRKKNIENNGINTRNMFGLFCFRWLRSKSAKKIIIQK